MKMIYILWVAVLVLGLLAAAPHGDREIMGTSSTGFNRLHCPDGFRIIGECYYIREKPTGVMGVIVDDGAPF